MCERNGTNAITVRWRWFTRFSLCTAPPNVQHNNNDNNTYQLLCGMVYWTAILARARAGMVMHTVVRTDERILARACA